MYFSLHPMIHADCGELLMKSVMMFVYIDLGRIVSELLYADVAES